MSYATEKKISDEYKKRAKEKTLDKRFEYLYGVYNAEMRSGGGVSLPHAVDTKARAIFELEDYAVEQGIIETEEKWLGRGIVRKK